MFQLPPLLLLLCEEILLLPFWEAPIKVTGKAAAGCRDHAYYYNPDPIITLSHFHSLQVKWRSSKRCYYGKSVRDID